MNLYRIGLSEFFKNYSNKVNGEDYKLKFDLGYWNNFRNELKCRSYFKGLRNYFKKKNYDLNGVYVNEFNKNYFIHSHSLIWCSCDSSIGKRLINDYCRKYKVGSVEVDDYNSDLGYNVYISKFLGFSEKNNYELIEML